MSSVDFNEIYSADLNRSKQTSKEIISRQSNQSLILDNRLREKSGGFFEGKPLDHLKKVAKSKNISLRKFKPNGGENWVDVFKRAQGFLDELIVKYIRQDYVNDDRQSVFEKSFSRYYKIMKVIWMYQLIQK